jgi:hypothetical protein
MGGTPNSRPLDGGGNSQPLVKRVGCKIRAIGPGDCPVFVNERLAEKLGVSERFENRTEKTVVKRYDPLDPVIERDLEAIAVQRPDKNEFGHVFISLHAIYSRGAILFSG